MRFIALVAVLFVSNATEFNNPFLPSGEEDRGWPSLRGPDYNGRSKETNYDWQYDAAGVYPGPRATPTYSDGRLYFAAPNGLIGCLDAVDGRRLWSVNLSSRFRTAGVLRRFRPARADGSEEPIDVERRSLKRPV